jgi:hypothetical protein
MELERKALCARVSIEKPGVIRGFDAMHVQSIAGPAYWLVAADAAVPYRTSIATVPVYDAEHVRRALIADFERHGRPLVLRLDRIACQRTAEIELLLLDSDVLPLHGPAHYPRYYGQLERQNRDHRAWYQRLGLVTPDELAAAGERMRTALNQLWPRSTLGGCTPEQAWAQREPVDVDRRELRRDVEQRATWLCKTGRDPLAARRIAIEASLTERGLLTIQQGGWC